MTEELRPCPFCNSTAQLIKTDAGRKSFDWRYVVHCVECHAEGQYDLGESGAIEVWNTRPIESAQVTRIAELEDEVKRLQGDLKSAEQEISMTERFMNGREP